MRFGTPLFLLLFFLFSPDLLAMAPVPLESTAGWQHVTSRYCTIWIDPSVKLEKVNKKISVRWIRSRKKVNKDSSADVQLAAKCDILFRRAEELLDMYPTGAHVTVRVVHKRSVLDDIHRKYYGRGEDARAFYIPKTNTVYVGWKDISESVLAHEMAHSIIGHYFKVRPPRKVEEMLAMHVDAELKD